MSRHPNLSFRLAGAGAVLAILAGAAQAATYNVPADYATIQDAVDAATDGDTILIADGNWDGADVVNKSLTIRSVSNDPASCVVDGGFYGLYIAGVGVQTRVRGIRFDGLNRGMEITLDASAEVENCVFRGASIGALFMNGVTLAMTDCTVRDNASSNAAGGMLIVQGDVTLTRTTWRSNEVLTGGAALGGAINVGPTAGLLIVDSTFRDNRVDANGLSRGGAIYASGGSSPIAIANTVFDGNSAADDGGAIYLEFRGAYLSNLEVTENTADFGGGIFIENAGGLIDDPVYITNSLIARNTAENGSGGGIRNREDSTLFVSNTTIFNNTSVGFGGGGVANGAGSEATFTSCVVGGNAPNDFAGAGDTTVSYSNVENPFPGVGNISEPPLLVDVAGGDYRLTADSPCVDAGDTARYYGSGLDLDGNVRVADDPDTENTGVALATGAIDMGCYELQPEDPCAADVSGNGEIDFADILEILSGWGPCP